MIILGIDPGETLIGVGIIKKDKSDINLVSYECICVDSEKETAEKLFEISEKLSYLIETYNPDLISIEKLFFFKNKKTIINVAQARGVLILTCQKYNLKILEFTPLQIKQAVACYGRADKKQVQKMVQSILRLKEAPKPDDVADALAAAICASNTNEILLNKK